MSIIGLHLVFIQCGLILCERSPRGGRARLRLWRVARAAVGSLVVAVGGAASLGRGRGRRGRRLRGLRALERGPPPAAGAAAATTTAAAAAAAAM